MRAKGDGKGSQLVMRPSTPSSCSFFDEFVPEMCDDNHDDGGGFSDSEDSGGEYLRSLRADEAQRRAQGGFSFADTDSDECEEDHLHRRFYVEPI